MDHGFVVAASSNIEIGGKGSASATAFFGLEHGQVHFYQGLQSCFWVRKLLEKTVPPWRGLRSARVAFLSHVRQPCIFVIKQKLSLDNIVLGGLGTGEASVALSPFFEVAGYNFGHMRAQKWFRLTDPILVPSLYLGTETGSAGRTLNRPLQKVRFTFQALLEFDGRVCGWAGLFESIHDFWQGDACIVAVARLVSLWRDICNYNSGGPVCRVQNFNGFTGPISRAVSVTTGSPKLLPRMWYDPINLY